MESEKITVSEVTDGAVAAEVCNGSELVRSPESSSEPSRPTTTESEFFGTEQDDDDVDGHSAELPDIQMVRSLLLLSFLASVKCDPPNSGNDDGVTDETLVARSPVSADSSEEDRRQSCSPTVEDVIEKNDRIFVCDNDGQVAIEADIRTPASCKSISVREDVELLKIPQLNLPKQDNDVSYGQDSIRLKPGEPGFGMVIKITNNITNISVTNNVTNNIYGQKPAKTGGRTWWKKTKRFFKHLCCCCGKEEDIN